jgi:hypothetical protein
MKANILSFSQIIDSTHGAREHYRVPKYQREYTWGKRNWEALLNDLLENDPGYFVGAIIVVTDSAADTPGCQKVYEVVDGQQRLTTLSLLMLSLYQKMLAIRETTTFEDEDERSYFETCLVDLRSKLVLKVKKEDDVTEAYKRGWLEKGKHCYLRVQPSGQNENFNDYRYALGEAGLLVQTPVPSWYGNRRIARALTFFEETLPTQADAALALLGKINQLQFVFISVGSQADAFTLFETLNNRGVPLSAIDIVKNKMIAEMQRQKGVGVDDSFEQWQDVVGHVDDTIDQERFLRHFYNANHWDPAIRISGITRANRAKIISIYEQIIGRDVQGIFDRLCVAASHYGAFLYPDWYEIDGALQEGLIDLTRISATPSYQLLLFLFTQEEGTFVEKDFLEKAVTLLRKYYIRRNVTDFPGTSALDQFHVETIAACQKVIHDSGKLTYSFLEAHVLAAGKYASLEKFRESLSGDIYEENSGMARYLLIKLDEQHHTREYAPDLWGRDTSDRFIWTIEHVLPQSEKLSKEWIQDLANGDPALARELHRTHLNRMGNLTLSGYNSRLSNASFAKKQALSGKKKVGEQHVAIGYRNKLALNSMKFQTSGSKSVSLASTATWNSDLIKARTNHMVEQLIAMFLFEGVES